MHEGALQGGSQKPAGRSGTPAGKSEGTGGDVVKDLLKTAQKNLENACDGREDVCSIRYHLGYIQAIKYVNKKLKEEGIDPLEDE